MSAPVILVVDDDPHIRDMLRIALGRAGFQPRFARDGGEGLRAIRAEAPDLVVLDIGLPERDGLALCREVRASSEVPIIFLTARDDEVDRILGLEMGGDDYVTKPFSPRELIARIRAVLKRATPGPGAQVALRHGAIELRPEEHLCRVDGSKVPLTATEISILGKLMSQPARVFSRPHLVDQVWGEGMPVSDRTLDSHLRNLRGKLAEAGCGDAIETLHGVGLRMGPCDGA